MPLSYASRHLATNSSNLSFQLPQSGFLSVLLHNGSQRCFRNMNVARCYAVFFHLFGQQMTQSNLKLFFLRVARETDNLHAVTQGRLNRVEHVSRRHEDHVRQIESYTEVVVSKAVVLLRIKNLQQCRRWIAAKVGAHFVDLI